MLRQSRSTNTLSRQAPLPSMLTAIPFLHASKRRAGELATLIRVEDLRLAMAGESALKRLDAECRLHRDRHAPRQHATAEPVEHDSQIDEAARHQDVGDVHRPHLVWPCDLDAAQKIRIDLVSRLGLRRARTAIE